MILVFPSPTPGPVAARVAAAPADAIPSPAPCCGGCGADPLPAAHTPGAGRLCWACLDRLLTDLGDLPGLPACRRCGRRGATHLCDGCLGAELAALRGPAR